MVQMDFNRLRERDLAVDLESGMNAVSSEDEGSANSNHKKMSYGISNGSMGTEGFYRNLEALSSISVESHLDSGAVSINSGSEGNEMSELEKVAREKQKKKSNRKHPKPPRPPRAPSLDAADQKLIEELSELARQKRAKIERMKALKKLKNAKSSSSSPSFNYLIALVITVIFFLVIIWQGIFARGGISSVNYHGSPESSAGANSGFISVQFYSNSPTQHDSSSASPNSVELVSGVDDHGRPNRGMV